jgi:hypothetical protein
MKTLLLTLAFLLCSAPAFAAPVCMYQDNLSGPATGGEGGGGTYVDIYGTGFGSSLGSISGTVNGTAITNFIYLGADPTSDRQKIGFQIPSGATGSGSISLTFPGGTVSTCGTFTVRTAAIYYFGPGIDNVTTGSFSCTNLKNGTAGDGLGGSGTYASPWTWTNVSSTAINGGGGNVAPPTNARVPSLYLQCFNAGDQIIFLNGANYTFADASGLFTSMQFDYGWAGSSTAPTVVMARPGASVTFGGPQVSSGIREYTDYGFMVAGLTIRGHDNGITFGEASTGPFMRLVGNDVSTPTGVGSSANITGGQEADTNVGLFILGNYSHDTSCSVPTFGISNKQYHSLYFFGNQIEVGWNKIANDCTYNGIQWNFVTDTSLGFGNGSIHDNDIEGVNGAGLNLATIDPTQGAVNIYNNVIHHVGLQPASDSDGAHACISFPGEAPSAGNGTVNVYNNTLWDCNSYLNTSNLADMAAVLAFYETAQTGLTINLVNNIIAAPSYTNSSSQNIYISNTGVSGPTITGSKNLFYSATTPGSCSVCTGITSLTIPTNPLFVSTTTPGPWTNLELQSGSPAIGAGTASLSSTLDFVGVTRPNPPAIGFVEPGIAPPTFLGVQFSIGFAASPGTSF